MCSVQTGAFTRLCCGGFVVLVPGSTNETERCSSLWSSVFMKTKTDI